MSGKQLMGLRMKVRSALKRHYNVRWGGSGLDWRVGRLFNECMYRGRKLTAMNKDDCEAALRDLS